jgi:hypothetical protein
VYEPFFGKPATCQNRERLGQLMHNIRFANLPLQGFARLWRVETTLVLLLLQVFLEPFVYPTISP